MGGTIPGILPVRISENEAELGWQQFVAARASICVVVIWFPF